MVPKGNVVARPRVMVLSWLILLLMVLSSVFVDAKVCYGSTFGCVRSPVADHKDMIYHSKVKRTPTSRGPNAQSNPQAHAKAQAPAVVLVSTELKKDQPSTPLSKVGKEIVYNAQGWQAITRDPKKFVPLRALSNPQAQPKEMVYFPQGCRCCWFYYSKPFIRCGDICCEEGCTCF